MDFVKDLILTESFLIKGTVRTGERRLSTHLNSMSGPFVEVRDATMIGVNQGERIVSSRALIQSREILLAHELIDLAGDAVLKQLSEVGRERVLVSLYLGGKLPLEVSGKLLRGAYDRNDLGDRDFLVMIDPVIEGLSGHSEREFKTLLDVPYVIINRRRVAYLFDFVT